MEILLDFETRSKVDISKAGADRYASDLSTDILCLGLLNLDTNERLLWYPADGPLPDLWYTYLIQATHVWAHNARFDQLIYEFIGVNDYGFPALSADVWACTSAMARVNALPASLDDGTRAINARHRKNHRGAYLIRQLSIPDKLTGEFRENPALLAEMGQYCMDDIAATASLKSALRQPTEIELRDWLTNERINDRGVKIDRELATLALQYAEQEKQEIAERLAFLTSGRVTAHSQSQRVAKFLAEVLEPAPMLRQILFKTSDIGERKLSCDKAAREALLAEPDLPADVREIVQLVHDGGKSSVSKFERMLNMADPDTDRVHGVFVYAGAGQTKRYASRGLQLHNMARDCFKPDETEDILQLMRDGKDIPAPVMHTLSKLLRPALIPGKGKAFVVGDWSSIEAMVLPWLSDSDGGEEVLQVFIRGEDIYLATASAMGIDDRQIGKVANLSLGYGGAAGAFNAMAKNYGLNLPANEVLSIVKRWRRANPWAVDFWRDLERAAKRAVNHPGEVYPVGRLGYVWIRGTLYCILPDESTIQYPDAKMDDDGTISCLKASHKPKVDDPEWPRMRLWGGLLAENVTQAVAACLLRELLARLDKEPVVGHVHDEVILEVPYLDANDAAEMLSSAMRYLPHWAEGLPLKAKPDVMIRYGK